MSPSKPWRTVLLGESTGRLSREQIRAAVLEVKAESESPSDARVGRKKRVTPRERSATSSVRSRETIQAAPWPAHDRAGLAALLRENLATVDRMSASLCRRAGLHGDDADDFKAWIRMRLVEDDYATLRKVRGESSFATYLMVVISMLFREYRVREWGRWRPSPDAKRLGVLAVRLETLIYRDGYTLSQAGQVLRSGGENVSDRQLTTLLARLPLRHPASPVRVGPEALAATHAASSAEERVAGDEADRARRQMEEALFRSLDRLPSEDQMIARMRIWEDMSVADISRSMNLPQKPLYRRLERIFTRLRTDLEAAGVTGEQVRTLLEDRP